MKESLKKEETKRDKFIRIAEARTNKIVDMVRLLGNLSNTSVYDFDKKDADKIFAYIEEELASAKAKFKDTTSGEKQFKL